MDQLLTAPVKVIIESAEELTMLLATGKKCWAEPISNPASFSTSISYEVVGIYETKVCIVHWMRQWIRFDDPYVRWFYYGDAD